MRIVDAVARRDTALWLKGNDPILFASALEEIDALFDIDIAVDLALGAGRCV